MGRRTGFEPATSRVADEVTAIFTTDRVEGWRGTDDAVAALAGEPPFGVRVSNPLGAVAPYHEVTDIFTTALPKLPLRQLKRHAGEQAISAFSDGNTGAPFGKPALWRVATLAWAPPQCVRQRRGSNPLFPWSEVSEIFTTSVWLSHVRSISCAVRQTKISSAAQVRRYCELRRVRSAIGIRLSPRSLRQAPRSWARASSARAPGSGSPVPALAGEFRMSHASDNKKPSGAAGSGGSVTADCRCRFKRDRSHESGVRYRSAGSRSTVGRGFPTPAGSHCSCWLAHPIAAQAAGSTPETCGCQVEER